jgi:transcriptional regulator with XRE-family HTH domain
MTPLAKQLGDLLTKARGTRSRRGMAADLGLAPATLISLEAGTINPTLARVEQMAAAYGIELELKAKRIRTPAPAGTGDLLTADVDERATRPPAVTP